MDKLRETLRGSKQQRIRCMAHYIENATKFGHLMYTASVNVVVETPNSVQSLVEGNLNIMKGRT